MNPHIKKTNVAMSRHQSDFRKLKRTRMDHAAQAQLIVEDIQRVDRAIAENLPTLIKQVDEWQISHWSCEEEGWVAAAASEDGPDRVALSRLQQECCTKLEQIHTLLRNVCLATKDFEDKVRRALDEIEKVMLIWRQWEQKRKVCKVENPVSLHSLMRECFQKLLPLILNWKNYFQTLTELNYKIPNGLDFPFKDLVGEVTDLVSRLLNQAFVVLRSPSLIKVAKVTLPPIASLLIEECTGVDLDFSKVSVAILWEDQVQHLVEKSVSVMPLDKCEEEFNGAGTEGLQNLPGRLACFKDLKALKVVRKNKLSKEDKGRGSSVTKKIDAVVLPKGQAPHKVTEEVSYMVFEATVRINGGRENGGLNIPIKTLSLPLSGSSHGSQDGDCDGHVMWYYAFGVMQPAGWISAPPKEVSLERLLKAISSRFELELENGLVLEEHIACLRERLLGPDTNETDDPTTMVTIEQFCESKIRWKVGNLGGGYDFSFWTWVFKAMSVIKVNLKTLWGMGCHLGFGFIRGKTAEALLKDGRPGTYLIRFSYSSLGGISASVVRRDGSVFHMMPIDYKLLKTESILSYLRLVKGCDLLYPNIEMPDSVYDEHKIKRAPQRNTTLKYEDLVRSIPQSPLVLDAETLDELNRLLPTPQLPQFATAFGTQAPQWGAHGWNNHMYPQQ